jgi:hypothetical protein
MRQPWEGMKGEGEPEEGGTAEFLMMTMGGLDVSVKVCLHVHPLDSALTREKNNRRTTD